MDVANRWSKYDAFFCLLKAGLWEKSITLSDSNLSDLKDVLRLSEQQSVVGLIAAGIEHVKKAELPQEDVLVFVGEALQLEKQNIEMNDFVGELISRLRSSDIYTLLIKGQGVALCYERPLWRAAGDIDLYLSDVNFLKAKAFFRPIVQSFEPDNECTRHINMHLGRWSVEIHADQQCSLGYKVNKVMHEIHRDLFYGGEVRSRIIGNSRVFLPSPGNDAIIVFVHFLNHFFKGGVGLRQICDWCRLLWTYRNEIDNRLLESRIRRMGILSEWRAFAAFAVDYLDMPVFAMPLYDSGKRWKSKAQMICSYIMKVGNFGRNRDSSFYGKYPRLVRKTVSFGRIIGDVLHHMKIFPIDSLLFLPYIAYNGIKSALRGE